MALSLGSISFSRASNYVQANLVSTSGRVYIVEASTDLVHWQGLGLARNVGQYLFEFEDVRAAHFPRRFYRVVSP